MYKITHFRFRGDLYEITYAPDGTIVEILLYADHGQRPEILHYWKLDVNLRSLVDDNVVFAMNHDN